MKVIVNSDNQTDVPAERAEAIGAMVESRLANIADRLTRVEVHVGDVNGPRGGQDMRCAIEIRPEGMSSIAATGDAAEVEAAVDSAADKVLSAFEKQVGRTTTRKGH